MKRFITLMVGFCAFFAVSAQHPMVTLSHNGELSFFSNLTALEAAIDSAKNGDTLYLSEGEFIVNGGALTIKKRLSIVGNGYGSHILGDLLINMYGNSNSVIDAPLFDGVRMEKLTFYGDIGSMNSLDHSEIRRCWIRELENGCWGGKNVTYDKCYIENSSFNGNGTVLVQNSKIGVATSGGGYIYKVTAINSHIYDPYYYPLSAISCIIHRSTPPVSNNSSQSLINCLLDFTPTSSSVYTHDCYIYTDESQPLLDDKIDCPLNLEQLGYLGEDGTAVGIYGGESPFSENPSVPTVDTANSSVEYDAAGNKLKVSITVKAD